MSVEASVWLCSNCATAHFPQRLICPRCGSSTGEALTASAGVIEQTTVVHRTVGVDSPEPRLLATVLLDAGPRVIVGLESALAPGTRVGVSADAGALRAAPEL